ncbi:MAG: methylated-DNA--[protein]-cysteine S-methyltransferase [Myxococcota bacterium]|nr:methylated-DNA--[protein]-cysteine S-methyltransferase [Myxococcota bacterium]
MASSPQGPCALSFSLNPKRLNRTLHKQFGDFDLVETDKISESHRKIQAYFEGEIHALEKLPSAVRGTDFQMKVWRALREVPPGQTRSYGDIARIINNPNAMRAVGMANNANPLGLVIPCHRVIGADGKLTGYAGGLDIKRRLLKHEGLSFP